MVPQVGRRRAHVLDIQPRVASFHLGTSRSVTELDDETIAYAHRMFDLARSGGTDELAGNVEAGLPVNLTND
jgi:hypothetical protein